MIVYNMMRLDDDSPVHESNVREDLKEDCIDIHRDTSRGLFRRADIQLAKQMNVQRDFLTVTVLSPTVPSRYVFMIIGIVADVLWQKCTM